MRDARCAVSRRLQAEAFRDEIPREVCCRVGVSALVGLWRGSVGVMFRPMRTKPECWSSYEHQCEMQERELRKCERIKTILDNRKKRRTNTRMGEYAEEVEFVE